MVVTTDYIANTQTLTMNLCGSLDSDVAENFGKEYRQQEHLVKTYLLDLRLVNYLDSSALKLLIDFCHYARENNADIFVMNMADDVLQSFRLLNLHKLFRPEYHREHYRVDWVFHGDDNDATLSEVLK